MYTPSYFTWTDTAAIDAFMARHRFATLIASDGATLAAQHIPMLIDRIGDQLTLTGHVARGNPLWQSAEALTIFHGPHAYISPTWYGDGNTVPTWNYQAVHAHGRLAVIRDAPEIRALFTRLGETLEGPAAAMWWQRLDETTYEKLASAIVWFRITVITLETKAKLSQNHTPERRQKVITALRALGGEHQHAIADAMETGTPPP